MRSSVTRIAFGVVVAALSGASANAGLLDNNIYLAFSDPFGQREFTYTAPVAYGNNGLLTYNNAISLNLNFDLSDFGLLPLIITSKLTMNQAQVGPVTPGAQPNEFLANASGAFSFRRAADDVVLLQGTFIDASLSMLRTSGGFSSNGIVNAGLFNLTFTPALIAELLAAGLAFPGLDETRIGDANWTLTSVLPQVNIITLFPPDNGGNGGPLQYFNNFNANSSFSATIPVLPTPGTAGLAVIAGLVMVGGHRRRR